MATKQYGLILSQKKKPNKSQQQQTLAAAASVFGKDSDTDDDDDQPVHSKHSGASMQAQRQMRLHVQQAVSDDPTIFQYDELYDDMVSRRKDEEVQQRSAKDQGPKYIKRLLETAEKRKRDYERRVERQVQKERDEEGDKFKDKDSFVTSSYKRKLDEMRAADEEERRNDHRESIADVTKQGNLDGFYRHLFQQRTKEAPTQAPERQYRKRTTGDDTDQPQETPDQLAKVHIDSNLDADSDFSIDSSDDDAETADEPPAKVADSASASEVPVGLASSRSSVEAQDPPERVEVLNVTVDIWKKRTTDASLDEAVKRYFERKADRADALY